MKKTIVCLCILLLTTCAVFGCTKEETPPAVDTSLFGAFTATDLEGNTVDQTIFSRSKLTMVNIWGTFCGPCISEMPYLGELNRELGNDFQVIGIVIDAVDASAQPISNVVANAHAIIDQTGADYLHLLPSPDLIRAYLYQSQAVPETIFLDSQGNQVGESFLGARNKEQWTQIIQGLLEEME